LDLFCSFDLDLDLDPNDLHKRTWSQFSGDTPDVQILTSYVKAFESYRLDIQTDKQTRTRWSKTIRVTVRYNVDDYAMRFRDSGLLSWSSAGC